MTPEAKAFKNLVKIWWTKLKRYMMNTSYMIPREDFYDSKLTRQLFKIIFSNLLGWSDSICIILNTALILAMTSGLSPGLAVASRVLTYIFWGLACLRLFIIQWFTIFKRPLVLLQVAVAAASLVKHFDSGRDPCLQSTILKTILD